MTPDPAQYARDAGNLTPEDTMKMTHRDYATDESAGTWRYQTRRKRPVIGSYAWFILLALLTVLASCAVAVVLSKAVNNLAYHNFLEDTQ